MKRIIVVVTAACFLCGCSHVHRVDPVGSARERDDLNRVVRDRQVSVELSERTQNGLGPRLAAESVRVGVESTSLSLLLEPGDVSALWGEPSYAASRDITLSTSTIRRMTIRSRTRGVLDGAVLGLVAGASLGALLGAALSDPWFGRSGTAAIGAQVFGIAGTGVGLVTGAILGSRETYEFPER